MKLLACLVLIAEFSFPGTAGEIAVPTRGGMVQVDDKRAANETQYAQFSINPWAFFEKYPKDHVYVLLDASLPGGPPPYRGRGIILSKAGDSVVVSFEDFSTATLKPAFSIPLTKQDVEITVHANRGWVAVWSGKEFAFTDMADNNKEQVSLVIIGATSDFSGTKEPVSIPVKNFRFGRFR